MPGQVTAAWPTSETASPIAKPRPTTSSGQGLRTVALQRGSAPNLDEHVELAVPVGLFGEAQVTLGEMLPLRTEVGPLCTGSACPEFRCELSVVSRRNHWAGRSYAIMSFDNPSILTTTARSRNSRKTNAFRKSSDKEILPSGT